MSQENKTLKLVILISNTGTGTNLKAIIDGVNSGIIKAEICAVISDTKNAEGLKYAREYFLNIDPVRNRESSQRLSISNGIEICEKKEDLLSLLQKLNPDYICLAGWKQIILDEVILAFPNKILNLHPGLIPDTIDGKIKNPDGTEGLWNKGMLTDKAIQNFLDKKSTFAGSSIHFLTLEFDFGPVLGRVFEKVEDYDNVESLYSRLKQKENKLYIEVLKKLSNTRCLT